MPKGEDAFILGHGYVGKATCLSLNIPYWFSRNDSNITLEEGSKKLFCFICLPTVTDEKGQQTESRKVIHDYIAQMKEYGGRNIFVIRSTVLPGTCRALAEEFDVKVASNPEMLSEDTWEQDAVKPRVKIIGADDIPTKIALTKIWEPVKSKIDIVTDTVTAETLKYAYNTFFTTKVIWANQMYDICQTNGAKYRVIKDALMRHPWGSKNHFKIMHKGGRGAGGHCLRKDTKVFAQYSNSKLLKLVDELNGEYLSQSGKS